MLIDDIVSAFVSKIFLSLSQELQGDNLSQVILPAEKISELIKKVSVGECCPDLN